MGPSSEPVEIRGKSKYLLECWLVRYPNLMLRALCGIFMIVSIETGGPRIAWDPGLSVMYARVVTTLDTRSAADMNSKGAVGRQPVPHREFEFEWTCLRSRCSHQYYFYHMRGLTGLGLVLFHPNIILLWIWHNTIWGWGLMICDCYYICKCYVGSLFMNCLYCNWL